MRRFYVFIFLVLLSWSAAAQQSRHFTFHYAFTVRNIEPGQAIEAWFPRAHSDQFQSVKILSAIGDLPVKKTHESKYGNTMFHAFTGRATKSEYEFDATYDVVRRERIGLPPAGVKPHLVKVSSKEADEYLGPDKLVPITGKLASIAETQVQGRTGTVDRARALYDYVLHTMRYDKSGTGWGRGDAEWACDSKRGNCTDFHSVFISMARSQHIPARFEIGFPLPADKSSGEIPGYHCWAEFYDPQFGWVPVDISEAWKDQGKKDYFFGAHDVNRVQFSLGRDLILNPPQRGGSLNYFVYPYVEVDGKKWENVSNQFSFTEVGTRSIAATHN
ncbi:MAG TPA: transglutaminase domain-containing protein [Terriglobales bacterium]|nr:transglutaminase domain-containing protein [Terriglobales bacterium]